MTRQTRLFSYLRGVLIKNRKKTARYLEWIQNICMRDASTMLIHERNAYNNAVYREKIEFQSFLLKFRIFETFKSNRKRTEFVKIFIV